MSFVLTGTGISTVVESAGSADAGKIALLDDAGKLDESVIPTSLLAGVPTGAVQAFAMATVPDGWLACDGSAVSRTTYSDLYSAIGTTFGSGDGSTTFNLPALQDCFPLAKGSTYSTMGATGGEVTHTLTTDEMPAHTHSIAQYYDGSTAETDKIASTNKGYYGSTTTGSTGGDGAHNNMPPYIVLNYCIKY